MPGLVSIATFIIWMVGSLSWGNAALGAETRKVRLGILQTGSQDFVHLVMEQQKLVRGRPHPRIPRSGGRTMNAVLIALAAWFAVVLVHGFLRSRGAAPQDPLRPSGPID